MCIKHSLKKAFCMLVKGRFFIYIFSLLAIFACFIQKGYSQETSKTGQPSHTTSSALYRDNLQPASLRSQRSKRLPARRTIYRDGHYAPIVDKNGNIYVSSHKGGVSAIDPNGNTKWNLHLADKINSGFVVGADNTLYCSSKETIYAVDPNGILRWIFRVESEIDFPIVLNEQGTLYLVTGKDDFLYAINPDGTLFWKAYISGHVSAPPTIAADGIIYVMTQGNMLYAISPDGLLRWRTKVLRRGVNQSILAERKDAVAKEDSTVLQKIRQTGGLQEQTILQSPLISPVKPTEVHYSENEDDRLAITSFTVSQQKGHPPLVVKFSDVSTGKVIERVWDFGDGTSSGAEQSPIHTYTTPGNYDVKLTVKRPDCTSTVIRKACIAVTSSSVFQDGNVLKNERGGNGGASSVRIPTSHTHSDTKVSNNETLMSAINNQTP